MRKRLAALLAVLLTASLCLAACGTEEDGGGGEEELVLTAALPDGEREDFLRRHLYENLMRWVDDGDGFAVLAPGQAESCTVETDYTGLATYTFTLRANAVWSDGQAVTAGQFADAWRRLADPASALPGGALMEQIGGWDQVQETGDTGLLAVSAPDDRTLVVTLSGDSAYFLETVCAGPDTVPVRSDLLSGGTMTGTVTNGPYVLAEAGGDTLRRSETYYDAASVSPAELKLLPAGNGAEADFSAALTEEELAALAADPDWTPEPVTAVYAAVLNTAEAPFDDPAVRRAFLLAVDEEALTAALGDSLLRPAEGLVPWGVGDHWQPEDAGESGTGQDEEPAIPDPGAAQAPETAPERWDFRAHSRELVTVPAPGDYAAACAEARSLLAQAGYENGRGLPEIRYVYVPGENAEAAAQALRTMWKEQLGAEVRLTPLSQEEYDALLYPAGDPESADPADAGEDAGGEEAAPAFHVAARLLTAPAPDACFYLEPFISQDARNAGGYASDAFDILMASAAAAISPDAWSARDAYLHDAEAILLSDAAVIPLYCQGDAYRLAEGLEGLYRGPDGCWYLSAVRRTAAAG